MLGVREVEFLGYHNDELSITVEPSATWSPDRRFRPDLVLGLAPNRVMDAPVDWSHGDHIAAGEATLQAVYPESLMPRIYPEPLAEGGRRTRRPRSGCRRCTDADLYVDVTDVGRDQDGRDLVLHQPERRGERRLGVAVRAPGRAAG